MTNEYSRNAANSGDHCPVRLLLFETDPEGADQLERLLSEADTGAFHLSWADSLANALEVLAREPVDVILVGNIEARHDRFATFQQLRQASPEALILPFGEGGSAREASRQPVEAHWLPQTLRYITHRKTAEADLRLADSVLFEAKERAEVTLNSIGDAVLVTDRAGRVTYINPNAEEITGWASEDAVGCNLDTVFRIVDGTTRRAASNPATRAIEQDETVGLAANCVVIRRDGSESAIEDSAAPIHDREGHVTGAVIIFRDVSQSRAMTRKMAHLARHDALTGLPNRLVLDEQLGQSIRLARRHGQRVGLLYIDMDNFKQINDALGHVVGDQVLRAVANRLTATVRASDTVCRHGGDEFVILLAAMETAGDAHAIVAKIREAFTQPVLLDGHALNIEMSIGVSVNPDHGDSMESLLRHADGAMYDAKRQRNTPASAPGTAVTTRHWLHRDGVERDLHRALNRGEFRLHYQPQIDVASREIRTVEVLLRWWSPDHGLVYPSQFVPLAEQNGLIVPIGRWVLQAACQQAAAWQQAGLTPPRFAVNVSAGELAEDGFAEGVATILSEAGVAADSIELELTETALLEDVEGTRRTLEKLSDMGIHLAIDDFGAGYSSLNYLRRFPLNTLKVDRSFLEDLHPASRNTIILRSILALGRDLGHRVVAEGVETNEELAYLESQHCEVVQGFRLGYPLAAEETALLLSRHQAPAPPTL